MSINIGDNFKYLGKKFLDSRESFATIELMKNCNDVPNGFITYCEENDKRYEYSNKNEIDEITGKWREFTVGADIDPDLLNHNCSYVGSEMPENDKVIWFDTGESNSTEINYENPIINELFACIRTLQEQVQQLQADVEYLKIHGGGGGGGSNTPTEPTEQSLLSLENGGLFLLEDGGMILLENTIATINESILLLENGAQILLENGANIKLEK